MAVPTDFQLLLFNKDRQYLAPVTGYAELSGVARHNALSAATLTVHPGHKRAAQLQEDGSRLIINFRGRTIMSGKTILTNGQGPGKDSGLSFEIEDDFRVFTNFLGWPVPGNAITNQNAEYHVVTGPAETVAKTLVTANVVPRAVYPVTVAATAGRGATITVMLRFDYLAEKLFPAVDFAGVGMTAFLLPDGSSVQVDAFTPTDRTATPLTVASRVIQSYRFGVQAPTITGGVLGGQGEGVARAFRTFKDAAREAAWQDTIEAFRDARDTSDAAVWTKREAETLGEGAPQYWVEVKLAEAGKFRIGGTGGYWLGDKVTADVGVIAPVTDVLREITYSVTTDGVKLGATVGRKNDPEEATMRAIATLTRGLRELRRSR